MRNSAAITDMSDTFRVESAPQHREYAPATATTRWVVDGIRAAFAGRLGEPPVVAAAATAAALLLSALAWGTRTFRRQNA